jgi:hypothetical protein
MNRLATIQVINNIVPIPNADKIEAASILGWTVVIRKDEFKIGDKCVYFGLDSILPKTSWTEFLVDKNRPDKPIRLKTRKLRGVVSQGLALPLSMVGIDGNIDDDVTEKLKVVKYDPQLQEENTLTTATNTSKSPVVKYLMGYAPFRYVYFKLNTKEKGNFPSSVRKTDEENLQNCADIISNNFDKSFYISEKCEGSSISFFMDFKKHWGFKRKVFGVCSRNIWLKTPDNSNYWQSARKYNMEQILKSQPFPISVQAEQIGVGIQKNIYKLSDVQIRVFNVTIKGQRLGLEDMKMFCLTHNLPVVPILDMNFIPAEHIPANDKATIVQWFLNYSNGVSQLFDTMREGVVVRLNSDTTVSFKVRSPDYLIKNDE